MTVGALFGCCKPEGVTVITRVPHGKVRVKRRYIQGLTSDPSPPERPAEREPRDPGRQLIRLTKHAEEAVEKRRLEMQWIEKTVLEPDFSDTDPNDQTLTRSFRSIQEAGGRMLRVVYRPECNDIVIVTVHFDRNARP